LNDLAADVKLGAFLDQGAGFLAEFVLADGLGGVAGIEKGAGRELESADIFWGDGEGAEAGVGPVVDGDFRAGTRSWGGGRFKPGVGELGVRSPLFRFVGFCGIPGLKR
jgi:hypothetical protein